MAVVNYEVKEIKSLSKVPFKVLYIGDLHLYNKDIGSMKLGSMVKNNDVMMMEIYSFLQENEDIKLVVFLGDIQHKTPSGKNTIREITKWKMWFKKIGSLMKERYPKELIEVLMEDGYKDINKDIELGLKYPLFTLKGNHDIDSERNLLNGADKDNDVYTFYDMCIDDGLLINPNQLLINKTLQVNFYNYGEADKKYTRLSTTEHVIGLYHDSILTSETPYWMQAEGVGYVAEEILGGIDFAIVGHIHTHYDPLIIDCDDGSESVIWICGSMGRTSIGDGQVRDVGYGVLVDLEKVNQLMKVEFDLIPATEYFNLRETLRKKKVDNNLKDFSLGADVVLVDDYVSPQELIKEMPLLDKKVKDVCLTLLDEISTRGGKDD